MKPINCLKPIALALFMLTLAQCSKNDCKGTYTIEGKIRNGTKNQMRTGILVEATAGKDNSLFSGSSNATGVGSCRTDENGYFKIIYNCIGDGMTGISLSSPNLPHSNISGINRLPINQNVYREYNFPDSVTVQIFIKPMTNLLPTDTVYLGIPGSVEYFDSISRSARFERVYFNSTMKEGLYKTVRIKYKDDYYPIDNMIKCRSARGYQNYIQLLNQTPEFVIELDKLEPEINSMTILY